MGPFELADYVGLDTTKFIIDGRLIIFTGPSLIAVFVKTEDVILLKFSYNNNKIEIKVSKIWL